MLYERVVLRDGRLVPVESRIIDQSTLTTDCWMVQFRGLDACDECEYRDTNECGGGDTLEEMKGG